MADTELLYADESEYSPRLRKNRNRYTSHRDQLKDCTKTVAKYINYRLCGLFIVLLLFLIALIWGMAGSSDDVSIDKKALQEISKGSTDFTFSLYKALSQGESGNIITSPLSAEIVLALAYFGARGNTATQLASGLRLPSDDTVIQNGFRSILATLKGNENYTLELANKVFSQSGFPILSQFQSIAERSFLSAAQELDFSKNEESAATINQWVEEKTRNKIKDLISPDMLDAFTRLVLVNAVYFKGKWEHQFKPDRTTSEPFYVSANEKKNVDMMHIKEKFNYADLDDLGAQALELPYVGKQMSMLILLPNDKDGIKKLEEKLPTINLPDIVSRLYNVEVNVSFPKFKLEQKIELDPILQNLGMTEMYTDNADFSGITGSKNLKVSKVVQKAFIEVNEEGSEAAAATGLMIMAMSMPLPPQPFVADHPFVFILRDIQTDVIIFLGRFSKPN